MLRSAAVTKLLHIITLWVGPLRSNRCPKRADGTKGPHLDDCR